MPSILSLPANETRCHATSNAKEDCSRFWKAVLANRQTPLPPFWLLRLVLGGNTCLRTAGDGACPHRRGMHRVAAVVDAVPNVGGDGTAACVRCPSARRG